MKLWQQQVSGTVKFFINFSDTNKVICLHVSIWLELLNCLWVIFHYAWLVKKTAAAIDNLCVSFFMVRWKQCFQFAAIYFVCYVSKIQYYISFQFWVYMVLLDVLCKPVKEFNCTLSVFKLFLIGFTLRHFLSVFPPCALLQYR